jgi:hypothetical protein
LEIKVFLSWSRARAIGEEAKMGKWVCTKKKVTTEGYHERWGEERNSMEWVGNKGVEKGRWVHGTKNDYK